MKNAIYHQDGKPPQALLVGKENADGTVNLVREDKGQDVVTNCPVSTDGKAGTCTVGKSADAVVHQVAAQEKADEKAAEKVESDEAKAARYASHSRK